MDNKDEKILELLRENSKLTSQQLSKKTLMPITTVHNRIKKMEKEGIIKRYTLELDNKKVGRGLGAYILITVDYKLLKEVKSTQRELARKIRSHPNVEESSMVTGGADIVIKVRVIDIDALDQFVTVHLRNINGIEKTQTMIILNEI